MHDCHIHMVLDGTDWKAALARHKQQPDEAWVRSTLQAYADAKTTYLRDGGDHCNVSVLARRVSGEYGIEYSSPIVALYPAGSYGAFLGRSFANMQEYERLVDEVYERGGDFVKVMLSGIMDFNEYGRITGFTPPAHELEHIMSYAHSKGLSVMAHINGARAIEAAVRAGVDTVEHGYFSDEQSREVLAHSNAVWVPTFAPLRNIIGKGIASDEVLKRIANEQKQAVQQVAAMGGKIALGSDAGAGGVLHVQGGQHEMKYMQEALGENCEKIITAGLEEIRARFVK